VNGAVTSVPAVPEIEIRLIEMFFVVEPEIQKISVADAAGTSPIDTAE
jgi:hypothetical protein